MSPRPPEERRADEASTEELNAFMEMLREREHILRYDGRWGAMFPQTELLESLCSKLRRRHHARHSRELGHLDFEAPE